MKFLKILLILVLIMIGLFNRHHTKSDHSKTRHEAAARPAPAEVRSKKAPVNVNSAKTPVNPEILHNAERLTETLRRCEQTAQKNRETKGM
jgi:hypothetical protein